MSNPTLLVEQFNGSLGIFTGVDPIRFDGGLWLEEGTTNYIANPRAGSNTTGWFTYGDRTLSRDTTKAYIGSASFKVEASTTIASMNYFMSATGITIGATGSVTASAMVYVPTSWTGGDICIDARGFGLGSPSQANVDMSKKGQWQRVSTTFTASSTSGEVHLTSVSSMPSGQPVNFTNIQLENKSYATSYCDGSLGTGYSWAGTAHASTSTRAASSASVPTAGIISPVAGAIAFRATPTIETGLEEIWGECGVKGAATDHTQWGRDATKHPFVEWSANNAAYQRITATETVDAETEYFFYFGYNGTDTYLQVDSGTPQTGTRDVVEDDFSVGDLTLEASAGGVIVSPFATFDRPLTDTEIATLAARQGWSMSTLAPGNRIRNQFELRPAY